MAHIKCTRTTSYGVGNGKTKTFEEGKIYEVGKDKDITAEIVAQMKGNRAAIDYVKPTKETLVEENKSMSIDENKGKQSQKPADKSKKREGAK